MQCTTVYVRIREDFLIFRARSIGTAWGALACGPVTNGETLEYGRHSTGGGLRRKRVLDCFSPPVLSYFRDLRSLSAYTEPQVERKVSYLARLGLVAVHSRVLFCLSLSPRFRSFLFAPFSDVVASSLTTAKNA